MAPDERKLKELLALYKHKKLEDQYEKTERPNKHTDRVAWNEHFERGLSLKYDNFSYPSGLLEDQPNIKWVVECLDIAELNQEVARVVKEIMVAEGELIGLALDDVVYGNFEAGWKALDPEKKKEIVLEGLYRGACTAPRDNSRISCPEMTIAGLLGDGEYNLINLVRRIAPGNVNLKLNSLKLPRS